MLSGQIQICVFVSLVHSGLYECWCCIYFLLGLLPFSLVALALAVVYLRPGYARNYYKVRALAIQLSSPVTFYVAHRSSSASYRCSSSPLSSPSATRSLRDRNTSFDRRSRSSATSSDGARSLVSRCKLLPPYLGIGVVVPEKSSPPSSSVEA